MKYFFLIMKGLNIVMSVALSNELFAPVFKRESLLYPLMWVGRSDNSEVNK